MLSYVSVPDGNTPAKRVVVLLHGYGAPGDDLVELGRILPAANTCYVFPAAPLDLGFGRAWWHIDLARIQRGWDRYAEEIPAELDASHQAVADLLDWIEREWKPKQLVLGGFSQGAMLALDVAVRRRKAPSALLLLSGSLVGTSRWLPHTGLLSGVPILISHGTRDEILPFTLAEKLRDTLIQAGARVTWCPFHGGHAIPSEVLSAAMQFMREAA